MTVKISKPSCKYNKIVTKTDCIKDIKLTYIKLLLAMTLAFSSYVAFKLKQIVIKK